MSSEIRMSAPISVQRDKQRRSPCSSYDTFWLCEQVRRPLHVALRRHNKRDSVQSLTWNGKTTALGPSRHSSMNILDWMFGAEPVHSDSLKDFKGCCQLPGLQLSINVGSLLRVIAACMHRLNLPSRFLESALHNLNGRFKSDARRSIELRNKVTNYFAIQCGH